MIGQMIEQLHLSKQLLNWVPISTAYELKFLIKFRERVNLLPKNKIQYRVAIYAG